MWEECLTVFLGEKVEGGITNIDLIRRGSNDHAFVGVSVGIHQFDAPLIDSGHSTSPGNRCSHSLYK